MSYIKQVWKTGDVISADKLNHIEQGLEAVEKEQGPAGITPELQNNGTAIQVSYDEGQSYSDLVQLSQITGPQGPAGEGFAIFKTYASVSDMEADAANVEEGKFVMISSTEEDPDNAKLYVKAANAFNFVTDLSGAQGIQGPQGAQGEPGPQGQPGKDGVTPVITVEAIQLASDQPASVVKSGTDAEPHFTFGIPAGQPGKDAELPDNLVTYSDFTYGDQQRKTIQLANYDSISGLGTDGTGYNIAMVSKWDKVDLGAAGLTMNLNSKDGQVQINDEKIIATVDQIPDVSNLATKEELLTPEEVVASEPMQDALETVRSEIPTMTEIATSPEVSGLVQGYISEETVDQKLADYATNTSVDEKISQVQTESGIVNLGNFAQAIVAENKAAEAGIYDNAETKIITYTVNGQNAVIINNVQDNQTTQYLTWNGQRYIRTVNADGASAWQTSESIVKLQGKAIVGPKFFALTTDSSSDDIKAAMTSSSDNLITEDDLNQCLKKGYLIDEYSMQSGSIFVGFNGQGFTFTYVGYPNPSQTPALMSCVVSVSNGEYRVLQNATKGILLTSKNLGDYLAKDQTINSINEQLANKQDKGDYATNEVVEAEFASYDKTIKSYIDSKLTAVYTYKGSVATEAELPEEHAIGDVWNVEQTGANFAWDGEQWDELGATIDLSAYAKTEDVDTKLATKANQTQVDTLASDVNNIGNVIIPEMNTNTAKALDMKVQWDEQKKVISLPVDGSISAMREADPEEGTQPEGSVLLAQRTYDEGVTLVTEVGTTKNKLTLNASERPQVDLVGGSSEKVAFVSDIPSTEGLATQTALTEGLSSKADTVHTHEVVDVNGLQAILDLMPVEIKLPIRTGIGGFQDKLYTQEEIFAWFGVTDLSEFLALAKSTRQVWISYVMGASFQTSAYRYLANYIEYVPSSQSITVIWVGPDSANADVISKFVFKANLDQTVIAGASNVQLTVTSIE